MQEQEQNSVLQQQEEKKRTRRKRNCEDQRNFKCNQCNKSYLSNAALYTHVKNKHEANNNKSAQKEKSASDSQPHSNEEESSDDEPVVEDFKEENLQNLRHTLKKYFPERNRGCNIKQILEGLSTDQNQFYSPLLNHWNENWDKAYLRDALPIDQVIGQFLFLMNRRVSSVCMNFLLRVFWYIRQGLHSETRDRQYCERQVAEKMPSYFNNLVMKKYIPPESSDEDELVNNSQLICKILQFFGLWLYDEKYTNLKIQPNN